LILWPWWCIAQNVTDGTASDMVASISVTMTSVADIELHFGQALLFSVFSEDVYVGYGVINDAKMLHGPSDILAETHMTYRNDAERAQLMQLLSNYSNGQDTAVSLREFRLSTPISWIAPALNTISMSAVFPGMKDKFIQSSILYAPRNPLKGVDFTLGLYNPQHCVVTITGMVATIFYENTEIGSVTVPSGLQITIPAGGNITSPILHADPHPAGVKAYSDLVSAGFGYVDVISLTYLSVVEFNSEVSIHQDGIPTVVIKL
jgi:molybdopterin-binding protein